MLFFFKSRFLSSGFLKFPVRARRMDVPDVPVIVTLDRSKFTKTLQLVTIKVSARQTSTFLTLLKEYVLFCQNLVSESFSVLWRRTKPIIPSPDDETKKLIYLDTTVSSLELTGLNENQKKVIQTQADSVSLQNMEIGYEQMTAGSFFVQHVCCSFFFFA